ncbi:hypothetical protein BDR04DRAFT_825325 [Suillus decipiens]|nr:hypothetical protein BDR04DRAFT_825325 [Suillus decipiens]
MRNTDSDPGLNVQLLFAVMMRKGNSSTQRDSSQETHTTSEATAPGSSYRSQSRFRRFLSKVKGNVALRISRSKDSRSRTGLVPSNANVNHERASSTSNVEDDLRFNICVLKSSYLPNNEDPELQERVQKCISPHLSYPSRFWTLHVRVTVFDKELAKEVEMFFDHERLFFWIELLGLIKTLGNAAAALPTIAQWLKVSTLLLGAR